MSLQGEYAAEMRELATGTLLRAILLDWAGRGHQSVHFMRLAAHYADEVKKASTPEERDAWAKEYLP